MKWIFAFLPSVFVLSSVALLRGAPGSPAALPSDAARAVVSRVESAPAIVERGAHHRVWQKTITETLANGRVLTRQSPGYTEVSVGLHYLKNGQWTEAKAEIELFQDGAVARQGQLKVIFATNIATIGAIDLLTPD